MWNCEKVTYTDGDYQIFDPANIGTHGDTGATIKSEKTQFYISSSNDTCVGGSWGDSPSRFANNQYMWTRTVYTLTNNDVIYGTPVFDKSYTSISRWCAENDETLIDGANIATGSIKAEQIDVGAITADHMSTDSLEAIAAKVETATIDTIVSSNYVPNQSGFKITTTDGVIDSKNLKMYEDGNVELTGTVYASGGEIGGNTIDETGLHITNGDLSIGNSFSVTSDGALTATSGKIGDNANGFSITSNAIRSEVDVSEISASLSNAYKVDKLYMTSCGTLNASTNSNGFNAEYVYNADEDKYFNNNYVYVGTDGIGTYSIYKVDRTADDVTESHRTYMANGQLYSNSGTIGGWTINADSFKKGIPGTDNSFCLSNGGFTVSNDKGFFVPNKSWALTINNGFGVSTKGETYISRLNAKDLLWVGDSSYTYGTDITIGTNTISDATLASNVTYDSTNKKFLATFAVDSSGWIYANKAIKVSSDDEYQMSTWLSKQQLAFRKNDTTVASFTLSNVDSTVWMGGAWTLGGMNSGNGVITVSNSGSIVNTSGASVSFSDKNLKNSIAVPSDKYDVFFDNLTPSVFKYNDGSSDRLHSGFIAQEVGAALEKAGLSTKEFAGYVDCKGLGMDNLGLRYEEFISLNTWQIQKLKARVAELEDKIALLTGQN